MELNQLKLIGKALDAELTALFAKYGLKLANRSATVYPSSGEVKYRITLTDTNLKDASGNETTSEAERFKKEAFLYGLNPTDLGKTFRSGGREFKIEGLKGGRSRKSLLVSSNGKRFVFDPADVVRLLQPVPAVKPMADFLKNHGANV